MLKGRFCLVFASALLMIGACDKDSGGGTEVPPPTNTDPFLAALDTLTCGQGQVAKYQSGTWVCADDADSLADLACSNGQVLKSNGTSFECGQDNGLNAAEVMDAVRTADSDNSLNAGTLGGVAASGYALVDHQHGGRTITVETIADQLANAALLRAALSAAAALSPTTSSPVLIKLEPGYYLLGALGLTIPDAVQLEGSGVGATFIWMEDGDGGTTETASVISIGSLGALRDLSISNVIHTAGSGAGTTAVGVFVRTGAYAAEIRNVEIVAESGRGFARGISAQGNLELRDVKLEANSIVAGNGYGAVGIQADGTLEAVDVSVYLNFVGDKGVTGINGGNYDMTLRDVHVQKSPASSAVSYSSFNVGGCTYCTQPVIVRDSSFDGKAGAYGDAEITNTTIDGNLTISNNNVDVVLRHSTVTGTFTVGGGTGTTRTCGASLINGSFYTTTCP